MLDIIKARKIIEWLQDKTIAFSKLGKSALAPILHSCCFLHYILVEKNPSLVYKNVIMLLVNKYLMLKNFSYSIFPFHLQVCVVIEYAEGELFQILEDDGHLSLEQVEPLF